MLQPVNPRKTAIMQATQDAINAIEEADELANRAAFSKSEGTPKNFQLQSALKKASQILRDAVGEYNTEYLQ